MLDTIHRQCVIGVQSCDVVLVRLAVKDDLTTIPILGSKYDLFVMYRPQGCTLLHAST